MISAVILGLALVVPAFTLPFTTQGLTTTTGIGGAATGIQQATGIQNEKYTGVGTGVFTHGEKAGVQGTFEGLTQETFTDKPRPIEKTGAQGSFEGYTGQKTSVVGAVRPLPIHEGETGTSEVYTPVNEKYQAPPAEQSFIQGSPETYNQKYPENQQANNLAVQKVEGEQISSDKPQFYLPVQPIYVSPESQGFTSGQKLTPVVVPTKTIAAGRVIIMTVEPIRQGFIQQDVANPEKQTLSQQITPQSVVDYVPIQGVESTQQQLFSVQPETIPQVVGYVEKQTPIQRGSQNPITGYNTVQTQGVDSQQPQQPQLTRNQPFVGTSSEKQSVSEYTQPQPVDPQLSGYQQVVGSTFEKQTSQSGPIQGLEPGQQQTYTSYVEKQGSPFQQTNHPENQPNRLPQQQVYTAQQTVSDQVEKQGAQGTGYTQTQDYKSQEFEPNQQQQYFQPQVAGYVANSFGEKLPQAEPVQTLSSVSVNPEHSVKPLFQQPVVPQQQVSSH